jgi:hypothetical protein
MRYRRDVPRDDQDAIDAETAHVRAHLSACCDPGDDEDARADEVTVTVTVVDHVNGHPYLVSIVGEIDAEPDAPYLREGYDPDADTEHEFRRYSGPEERGE